MSLPKPSRPAGKQSRRKKLALVAAPEAALAAETATRDMLRDMGGSEDETWNYHLIGKIIQASPGAQMPEFVAKISSAMMAAQLALKPADPIEAMLSGQLIAANDAALEMYQRAWRLEQGFDIRTRYLALADKAARTVVVLTEALDRHRGRGQQHITVKHVTVHANQAVVADQVVTSPGASGGGGDDNRIGGQPHALTHAPGAPMYSEIETLREAVPLARR